MANWTEGEGQNRVRVWEHTKYHDDEGSHEYRERVSLPAGICC